MKHNHALTLAFEVASDDPEQPSLEEILFGLARRIASLNSSQNVDEQWRDATQDVYDTCEFEPEEHERWLDRVKVPPELLEVFSNRRR